MNEVFCKINNKGAISGYATIFFYFFIDLWYKMAYRGKTMIFLQKLVFTFIYPIDFRQYEGKSKFLRNFFSGKKMSFPLKF